MASVFKSTKKAIRRRSARVLTRSMQSPPGSLGRRIAPTLLYADMLVNDYGIVRLVFANQHQIAPDVWRSGQPWPWHIARLAAKGVKTIINLRGDQTFGTRWLEEQACARHGIRLMDVALKSRAAPTRDEFIAIRDALAAAEYPILLHCKSGSDRAGLMSVMVRHLHEGVPISEARHQLGLRYGHIRQAETGVLGKVFDSYLADNAETPISFFDWVETRYDPDVITRSFRGQGWANRLVDTVLQRE